MVETQFKNRIPLFRSFVSSTKNPKKNSLYPTYLSLFVLIIIVTTGGAQPIDINSPDNQLNAEISIEEAISISISHKGSQVAKLSNLFMKMDQGRILGKNAKLISQDSQKHKGQRKPVVPN